MATAPYCAHGHVKVPNYVLLSYACVPRMRPTRTCRMYAYMHVAYVPMNDAMLLHAFTRISVRYLSDIHGRCVQHRKLRAGSMFQIRLCTSNVGMVPCEWFMNLHEPALAACGQT